MKARCFTPAIVLFLLSMRGSGIFLKNPDVFLGSLKEISFEYCDIRKNLCFINKRIRPPPDRQVKK